VEKEAIVTTPANVEKSSIAKTFLLSEEIKRGRAVGGTYELHGCLHFARVWRVDE